MIENHQSVFRYKNSKSYLYIDGNANKNNDVYAR